MEKSQTTDTYILRKSTRKDKKYMLISPDGKMSHFGANGMDDYLIKGDDKQKARYLKRH